jgi:hypothetical protein
MPPAAGSANDPIPVAAAADVAWLADYLRDRAAFCPDCGTGLRGLSTGVCPHCRSELALTLGTVEPPLRAWILLAVATCASAGVGLFMIALIVRQGPPPRRDALIFGLVWFFAASVLIAPVVLLTRRRFMRLSRAAQSGVATVGVTIILVAFIALVLRLKFG